jgi:regulator of replication initiation timing
MTAEERKKYDDSEKVIHEIAWIAWKGAANAYRMYPDNSHTFSGYWDGAKDQFQKYIDAHNLQQEKIAALESRNEELVKALDEIHKPITYMQKRLKEGQSLNGAFAIELARSPEYLNTQQWAFERIDFYFEIFEAMNQDKPETPDFSNLDVEMFGDMADNASCQDGAYYVYEKYVKPLQQENASLKAENERLRTTLVANAELIKELATKVADQLDEICSLREQLDKAKSEYNFLEKVHQVYKQEEERFRDETFKAAGDLNSELEKQVAELREQNEKLEEENKNFKERLSKPDGRF